FANREDQRSSNALCFIGSCVGITVVQLDQVRIVESHTVVDEEAANRQACNRPEEVQREANEKPRSLSLHDGPSSKLFKNESADKLVNGLRRSSGLLNQRTVILADDTRPG